MVEYAFFHDRFASYFSFGEVYKPLGLGSGKDTPKTKRLRNAPP